MSSRTLVTGGAGFIGSHVVNHLIQMGHEVVVLDDLSGGFKRNVHPKATMVIDSITNTEKVNQLFEKYRFDYVYHFAAYAAEGLSPHIRQFNYENNLMGSINLINASVNFDVKCFVFTSSIAVYGSQTPPFTELMVPQPEDPYGIAKYAVELDLKDAQKRFGLNHVIFRPHNVFGVGQNLSDPYRNVVGIFMNQLIKNQSLTIFGDGRQTRAFTPIEAISESIAYCISNPNALNQTFNVGSDEVMSLNELADVMKSSFVEANRTKNIEYLNARDEVEHAFSDHSKFNRVFTQAPTIKMKDAIVEMAHWAKTIEVKPAAKFEHIEIEKNLPDSWD